VPFKDALFNNNNAICLLFIQPTGLKVRQWFCEAQNLNFILIN